jgi:hypothetical protein
MTALITARMPMTIARSVNAVRTYAVGVLPSAERYFYFLGASFFRSTSEKKKHKKGEYLAAAG